jgi:ATP-binding cassette subfamily C (CFTR/MRP) protein 1
MYRFRYQLITSAQPHLTVLVILRFVLLLLWSIRPPVQTSTSIAAASVFLVESFAFVALSRSEHVRSVRPSSLLNLYFLFSLALDVIRMRTLVKLNFDNLITSLCAADMAIKLSLLFLEAQNKRIYFSPTDSGRPPQEISGILNRNVFWWLNSLFFQGEKLSNVLEAMLIDNRIS